MTEANESELTGVNGKATAQKGRAFSVHSFSIHGGTALVDEADLEYLGQWSWHAHHAGSTTYARRNIEVDGRTVSLYMHRAIMVCAHGPLPPNSVVDHIDRNGLNNQRQNLRVVTQAENLWNTKRQGAGTSYHAQTGKWRAFIDHRTKRLELGLYETQDEAAKRRILVQRFLRDGHGLTAEELALFPLPVRTRIVRFVP